MKDGKLLLREHVSQLKLDTKQIRLLKEQAEAGEPLSVVGIIQRADAKNQNGRIYPYEVLKKECERYKNEFVDAGRALGELDHTDDSVIQLKNVSHLIEDLWWDGPNRKEVWGRIKLLPTPAGEIAKKIALSGIPLGISSRAVGSLSKNESKDGDVVGEDLNIICWDLVGTPSTHNAYLKMHESKPTTNFNESKILPASYRLKSTLQELLKK